MNSGTQLIALACINAKATMKVRNSSIPLQA